VQPRSGWTTVVELDVGLAVGIDRDPFKGALHWMKSEDYLVD
jgi:hypothetical protein